MAENPPSRSPLARWFAPPVFDSAHRTQQARSVQFVVLSIYFVATALLSLLIVLQPDTLARRGVTLLMLLAMTATILLVNRKWPLAAGIFLVVGLLVLITERNLGAGGINAPATGMYVVIVLIAGLLFGMRGGILFALLTGAAALLLAVVEIYGKLPESQIEFSPLIVWLYNCLWIGFALVIQVHVSTALRGLLNRAEGELVEKNRALHKLGERVKELGLLHTTAQMLQGERKLDTELLQQLVSLVAPAWQFPGVCEARIRYGELEAQTAGWKETEWVQSAKFETSDGQLNIEVAYTEERPQAAEGPFLEEERALLRSFGEMLVAYIALRKYQEGLEQLVETRTQELQSSYERLQNLEKLRDDLVHMIVHDMRSPLTALMMSLDLLKKKFGTDLAMPMESALRTTSMLNMMANNLLDVSRLEEGKMPLQRSNVDVSELAGQAVTALQMLDQSRTIEVDASKPAPISCDRGLIRRVLENLISNGFKHTPKGSTLRIVVTPTPGKVRVEVIDQGEGVPREARERIFEKFGALEAKRDQTYHSAGLGLAFCKMAIEAHNGKIGVGDAEGGGSNFWIELPEAA